MVGEACDPREALEVRAALQPRRPPAQLVAVRVDAEEVEQEGRGVGASAAAHWSGLAEQHIVAPVAAGPQPRQPGVDEVAIERRRLALRVQPPHLVRLVPQRPALDPRQQIPARVLEAAGVAPPDRRHELPVELGVGLAVASGAAGRPARREPRGREQHLKATCVRLSHERVVWSPGGVRVAVRVVEVAVRAGPRRRVWRHLVPEHERVDRGRAESFHQVERGSREPVEQHRVVLEDRVQ